MLNADNLTISVPVAAKHGGSNPLCNKNCGYCISLMTGFTQTNETLWMRNMKKVVKVAEANGIDSVLVTSKGEPLLNMKAINTVSYWFHDYPLELQTNGTLLTKDKIETLWTEGFNIVAVSVDHASYFNWLAAKIALVHQNNMLFRLCINVSDMLGDWNRIDRILNFCRQYSVDQLLLRQLSVPTTKVTTVEAEWIKKHDCEAIYTSMAGKLRERLLNAQQIRKLRYGVRIYDLDGMSVSISDNCIQEASDENNLRSLIYGDDGHLYTSWDSRASKIF
jgi:molybdenum cofactor biosynthesis enzyme MoaA